MRKVEPLEPERLICISSFAKYFVVFVFALLQLLVCSSASAAPIEKSSSDIKILVRSLIERNPKEFWLTSEGGDVETHIQAAQDILASGRHVNFDRLCASACANYLFFAAKTKTLAPRTLLLFHGTVSPPLGLPEALEKRVENCFQSKVAAWVKDRPVLNEQLGFILGLQRREREFIAAAQVPPILFYLSDGILGCREIVTNLRLDSKELLPHGERFYIGYKRIKGDWFAPSPELLRSMGAVGITSMWYPASKQELESLFHEIMRTPMWKRWLGLGERVFSDRFDFDPELTPVLNRLRADGVR